MRNNVYTNAKIVKAADNVQSYELGTFLSNDNNQNTQMQNIAKLDEREINGNVDPLLEEVRILASSFAQMQNQISLIANNGKTQEEIDKQVVEAIRDLKHYASFFEQATFQMETKLLKTSMAIAKKIINIEIGANSSLIAKETISNLLLKVKTASKVKIHLSPKDYEVLKRDLNLESHLELVQDANVTPGGVVIASDLGNFDGNIEAKVASMLESLESII
ncbi:MAG: flagellar assembly protein FliH [Campylobacteraceae bacterium]|nr:flagellar assembly protein FliH [Campylobacteraceae bacterium]